MKREAPPKTRKGGLKSRDPINKSKPHPKIKKPSFRTSTSRSQIQTPRSKTPTPPNESNTMATMPKEYWETYERKSPHLSGKFKTPRLMIRCDWTLIDNAASSLGFSSGCALVTEMAHRAATNPQDFQTLVNEIEAGSFDWAGVRGRTVASTHWGKPGVADAVREALRRISYGPDLGEAG